MIRDATERDFGAIIELNTESEHFLSPLTPELLRLLHAAAAYHRVACLDGVVVGFLLAFRDGACYDGDHYRWFCAHYASFLYVDRVVVRAGLQGQQVGSRLYTDVFSVARQMQVPWVTCEVDVDPPNDASLRFHRRFGFAEVARHPAAGGKKTVSLQVAPL